MNRLEAVADAIMSFEGWNAGSRSQRNRNPGNLRDSSIPHLKDAGNYCVFSSLQSGYEALLRELTAKFIGENAHGIGPDSTLRELMNVYAPAGDDNQPAIYANYVAVYLQKSLNEHFSAASKLREIWQPAATQAVGA